MSEPAGWMNWPGAAARRISTKSPSARSRVSVCSTMTTASAPRGTIPPVAMTLAVQPQQSRRFLGGAGGVGGPHREPVDARPVEAGHVGSGHDVPREDAAERGGERNRLLTERREPQRAAKPALRLIAVEYFEKLLLPRRPCERRLEAVVHASASLP